MKNIRDIREDIRQRAERAGREIGRYGKSEGRMAKKLEAQTAKLPSDLFLWAAGASILGSLVLHQCGRKDDAQFVGEWVPSLLILGVYNKIVKELGHD